VSVDGRYLVAANGTVIAINGRGLAIVSNHAELTTDAQPAFPDSLADHDQALVLDHQGRSGASASTNGQVAVVSLATGNAVSLGVADSVAGDPQQVGVFVSVASGQAPPAPGPYPNPPVPPDGRVELRDVGRPTVVLASAATLNRALGNQVGEPVTLAPYPSPTGDRVAISVMSASGADSSEGVVIVDRFGRLESIVPSALGPGAGEEPTWSPSGDALAYVTAATVSSGLAVWRPGQQPTIRADPTAGDHPVRCVWSPNGASILCETLLADGTLDWDVTGARGGSIAAYGAPGPALAWLTAGSS
jgi:hypothetical protein